jgi:hypothetical protein
MHMHIRTVVIQPVDYRVRSCEILRINDAYGVYCDQCIGQNRTLRLIREKLNINFQINYPNKNAYYKFPVPVVCTAEELFLLQLKMQNNNELSIDIARCY